MRRKPLQIKFDEEVSSELQAIKAYLGEQVPLSMRYVLGPKATLVSIDGEMVTLQFPNGARLVNVPL